MKISYIIFLFLLFTSLVKSQSLTSNLMQKVASINSIIVKDKMIRMSNPNSDVFYPTKIAANLQGEVFCVDSLVWEKIISKRLIFNILKVKSFVIRTDEILGLNQNEEPIITISQANQQKRLALKKELDTLLFICITYSKQDPKFKCD